MIPACLHQLCSGVSKTWLAIVAVWLLMLIALPISLSTIGESAYPLVSSLGILAQLVASLTALAQRWSEMRVLITAVWVMAIAYFSELLGVSTGFPFGRYAYTSIIQPQLANVPVPVAMAWFMMLAPAWGVAEAILGRRSQRFGRWYPLVFAGLAGLAFTAWDLYLDPQMVRRGMWVWEQPGAYFGIPLSNYLGWWLVATLVTLIVRPSDLPWRPLFIIYSLTWINQAVGQGLFWSQLGPTLAGLAGMGLFVWLGLASRCGSPGH